LSPPPLGEPSKTDRAIGPAALSRPALVAGGVSLPWHEEYRSYSERGLAKAGR
jgi:hypothetical protein